MPKMSDENKIQKVKIDLFDPVHFFAFGFGSGLSPVAPGTAGTLAAVPVYLLLALLPLPAYLFAVLLALMFGIWACGLSSAKIGVHDHSGIVWDEIAGYLLVMTPFVPTFAAVGVGFVVFRFFDIIKPWPIRWIDRHVGGGFGIMLDDVLAAVFSVVFMVGALILFPEMLSQYVQIRPLQ